MIATLYTVLFILFLEMVSGNAQQLAFPGAEGFGRFATGGRNGTVYHVSNLNDTGEGSFRDAVSKPNRTVVFDVGGVIKITTRIVVSGNITIAGQTAPGDGITIYGNGISYSNANNTITRFIRYRMSQNGTDGKDAIAIADGHDIIMDHVSVSWGRDGTLDVNGEVKNFTFQNGIVSQGLQTHSTGGLMQSDLGTSILRTLYIDNHTRNPKVKGKNQFVNNVIYNWEVGGYILGDSDADSWANVTGNYFINGPSNAAAPFTRGNAHFNIYATNNYHDNNRNSKLDGALIPRSEYGPVTWQLKPYDYPPVKELSPIDAFTYVLKNAGASFKRDEVDKRMIQELSSLGTLGEIIKLDTDMPMKAAGIVKGGPAPADTDQDGMPDAWEKVYGTDVRKADNNGDLDKDGYTNLENYLHCIIEEENCKSLVTAVEGDEANRETGVIAAPNPFTDNFQIIGCANFQYSVYDILGNLLETDQGKDEVTLGAFLRPGIYILNIKYMNNNRFIRLIKN